MMIETASRLHFGIIDMSRKFIREYGALGVMIKGGFRIEIIPVEEGLEVEGDKDVVKEVRDVYDNISAYHELKEGYHIKVLRKVPRHIGLGSTTQLHMGVGMGILKNEGYDVGLNKLAEVVGRSRYSAIGTYGFKYGGFILEGGKAHPEEIPPLTAHFDVPDDWRFVIVCPKEIQSYDENEERPIMDELQVDARYPRGISHHILMGILPAIKNGDIQDFGYHLAKLQRLVGESFSTYQGGVFHPAIADVIDKLNDITYGAGQSSWGPTAYGLTTKEKSADVKKRISEWLDKEGKDAHIWVAQPENGGVVIER